MPVIRAGAMAGLVAVLAVAATSSAMSQSGTAGPPAAQQPEALRGVPGITVLPPRDAQGRDLRPGPAPTGEAEGDPPQGCRFIENKLELIV